jgi:hypothetical protein
MNDPSILIWFAVAFVAIFLLPYILGPIMLRLNMTQDAHPEVVPFPIDHPDLPEPVRDHFDAVTVEMARVGFEPVAGLALPRQTPNVKAVILMFANRATKDAAIATAIYADKLQPPLQTAYVEIVSRFRDGRIVQTNNSHQMGAFPEKEGITTTYLPSVPEADRLYRIHLAIGERAADNAVKVLRLDEDFRGDARAYLACGLREELERQIDTGYLFLDSANEVFRPTLKGAFLMCWAMLFPWKQLRFANRNRKEKRLLEELRVEGKI